jgi:molybdate transport system permease protein
MDSPMQMDWFPLWLSLRVAALATLVALPMGLWLACLLAKREFRGKAALEAVITLPLVLPTTVLAYYVLVWLGRATPLGRVYESLAGAPLVFTWQAAVVAALIHSAPLLVKSARGALESVDRNYERAARNLGASEWRVFWRVTLPLVRRSILAAALLAFARSLGDLGITIMIAGNLPGSTQTLPAAIYRAMENGGGTLACVLVLVIAAAVWILANRLGPRQAAR